MKIKFGLGVLAYLVPTFALGFVWHLVLFTGYYERLAIYRKDIIIPFGFLSMLTQALLFCLGLPADLCQAQRGAAIPWASGRDRVSGNHPEQVCHFH